MIQILSAAHIKGKLSNFAIMKFIVSMMSNNTVSNKGLDICILSLILQCSSCRTRCDTKAADIGKCSHQSVTSIGFFFTRNDGFKYSSETPMSSGRLKHQYFQVRRIVVEVQRVGFASTMEPSPTLWGLDWAHVYFGLKWAYCTIIALQFRIKNTVIFL